MVDVIGLAALGVGGFAIGYLIGIALRFVTKIAMYVVGLYLASLIALSSLGAITIHWDVMTTLVKNLVTGLASIAQSDVVTSTGAFGVTLTLGTIYGALRGTIVNTNEYKFFKRVR